MDLFDYQYFKFCRLHLQFSGLWPYQTNIIAIPVTIVMILLIITFAITQVTHILKFRGDAEVFLDTFSLILATLHVFILYFNNLFNLGSLKVMLERIKYDWRCAVLNKEDHILEAIMKEGWKYSSYYLTCSYPLMLFLIIVQATPVILNNLFALNISYDRQPIDGEFFVDRDEYFSLIIMYLTFILCASNIITFATNLQFNMLVHHACGMFAIFGHRLEHMFHYSTEKPVEDDKVQIALVRIIEHHKQIMQYIDTVNSYYSAAFSFLLLFSSLFIANLLVNLCFKIKNMESIDVIVMLTITPHIVVFSDIWASMFMAALSAQKLIDASSGVFQQMYFGKWYVASVSNQKILLFMMHKCMKPATVAFSNIITISLEKFATVQKATMSYFTLLYSMQ
ncbi:uncharacterized protein LOC143259917 isoform X2 [Megalopta genalis]|uniref:uncharacterized protein LOC143259917 isoform X2 n=1 Tax=Megalopta genalis TaxID=115081 RepID=UPI003FD5668C